METGKSYPIASRVASLILLALVATWATGAFDVQLMEKFRALSGPELLAHEETVHGHSFPFRFIVLLIFGALCFAGVEVLAYLLRSVRRPKDKT